MGGEGIKIGGTEGGKGDNWTEEMEEGKATGLQGDLAREIGEFTVHAIGCKLPIRIGLPVCIWHNSGCGRDRGQTGWYGDGKEN